MEDRGGYCKFRTVERIIEDLPPNSRDRAVLTGLLYSGRRVGEFRLLRPMDFLPGEPGIWWFIEKKRGNVKPRVSLPIAERAYTSLKEFAAKQELAPEEYVINGRWRNRPISRMHIWRIVKQIAKDYGLKTVSGKEPHPHTFRHTYAIHVLERDPSGRSLTMLQNLLQHSDIRTTMFYLQFVKSDLTDYVKKIFEEKPELVKEI